MFKHQISNNLKSTGVSVAACLSLVACGLSGSETVSDSIDPACHAVVAPEVQHNFESLRATPVGERIYNAICAEREPGVQVMPELIRAFFPNRGHNVDVSEAQMVYVLDLLGRYELDTGNIRLASGPQLVAVNEKFARTPGALALRITNVAHNEGAHYMQYQYGLFEDLQDNPAINPRLRFEMWLLLEQQSDLLSIYAMHHDVTQIPDRRNFVVANAAEFQQGLNVALDSDGPLLPAYIINAMTAGDDNNTRFRSYVMRASRAVGYDLVQAKNTTALYQPSLAPADIAFAQAWLAKLEALDLGPIATLSLDDIANLNDNFVNLRYIAGQNFAAVPPLAPIANQQRDLDGLRGFQ